MIIVVCALLAMASVPLTGGDVRRLGALRWRAVWLVWAAIIVQTLLVTLSSSGTIPRLLHGATYVMAATFVVANIRIPGVAFIASGGALNALAIFANDGVMPASATARRVAGLAEGDGFSNSATIAAPRLSRLGDIFAVPKGWPFANVFSIGDVIIVAGVVVLAHLVCRRPATDLTLEQLDARR